MKRLAGVLSVLLVGVLTGACAPQLLPLADVQQLNARDGSYGQDIYGLRRAAGETVPNMRGNQVVHIRTFTAKTNDFGNEVADQEVAGAECLVRAEDAEARIRTPGALHVPLYGYRSPDMTVQCIKPGFQDAVSILNKYNRTQAEQARAVQNAAAGGGIIGALVGVAINTAIAAANDPTDDVFNYRAPQILLRPGQGSEALPESDPVAVAAPAPSADPVPVAPSTSVRPGAGSGTEITAPPPDLNGINESRPQVSQNQQVTGTSGRSNVGEPARQGAQYGAFTTPGLTDDSSEWEKKCKPFCS